MPSLRKARKRIEEGGLLKGGDVRQLGDEMDRDDESRAAQKRLCKNFLSWRTREAQRLVKARGMIARLRTQPEDSFAQIDRRALRRCRSCEEIAYPDPENARDRKKRHVATRCHYCGAGALAEIEFPLDEGGWN